MYFFSINRVHISQPVPSASLWAKLQVEKVQLWRIKLGQGAFRLQTIPLGAEKLSWMADVIALRLSQKCWPPGGSLSSPSGPTPHRGCTCKQDSAWAQKGPSGQGQWKSAAVETIQLSPWGCWPACIGAAWELNHGLWRRATRGCSGLVSCPRDCLGDCRVRKQAAWGTQWCWTRPLQSMVPVEFRKCGSASRPLDHEQFTPLFIPNTSSDNRLTLPSILREWSINILN